ncbi:hypothetical protein KI688_010870 [Linnemannia hyalina]|uniref:BTB domain-containing protein n=1 Tax=Linnemannia hyalina TaxID=64524 RepID=A0A9P7XZ90_9FUNG|nr:hypothetical protein KI688_010870 [Linnemannia hyalina]
MSVSASTQRSFQGEFASNSNGLFQTNTSPLQYKHTTPPQHHQQQQQHRHNIPSHPQQRTQVSTKALALTSTTTKGTPPPPLMGSAIVLVNDSALHCFGGRLENRDLTNVHYVLDVETGFWDTLHDVSSENNFADPEIEGGSDPSAMLSLSLTTDPVEETHAGTLSDPISVPPSPRYFHTLNAFGTSLILFGGMGKVYNGSNDGSDSNGGANDKKQESGEDDGSQDVMAALNDLHVFDIVTQRWQQKHPQVNAHSPKPRWAHMATILDHYLVVIGGTDTAKAYVEDACVLDLHTWEWVSSIQSIGQCGSYRTIAATGPGKQSASSVAPASPSFPSATASSPQTSANLSWPSTDSGPIDTMASISMVLSGRISAPSSTTASSRGDDTPDGGSDEQQQPPTKRKNSERLMSGELTPAFRTGRDVPSIYLYSNYDFKNLQRDFKVITPHYTHPAIAMDGPSSTPASTPAPPPSFSLVEKTQALAMMGHELPPGLRFPQGHVYQNQLILTGTLILPGKKPTLAIYAFNLTHYKWEQLSTDNLLETGSWSRTLLHPATGTLFIFGNQASNADEDYANRLQHHNHIMMVNLQAYGLYERPIPSFSKEAQDLGLELLSRPSLSDMQVCSAAGTLFGANSTVLAARWPEFSTMLLSPPYVTPLVLILPVPDDVVPLFLQYLYTGSLPTTISAGMADYLLILARRYELNGLYALTMDILHQLVHMNPIRIYSTALMAGELGLQARAIGLAVQTLPAATEPRELPPVPAGIVRSNSLRAPPPPSTKVPYPPTQHRRAASRDSISTDGGHVRDNLLQQYNGGQRLMPSMIQEVDETGQQQHQPLFLSSPSGNSLLRPTRAAPLPPSHHQGAGGAYQNQPISPLGSPTYPQGGSQYQTAYPSPLSPSFQQHLFTSQPIYDDYQLDDRTLQAKKRLQMQMQYDMEQQVHQHQMAQQEYIQQQQHQLEQEHMRGQEMLMLEQHRLQHQRYLQKQQQLRGDVLPSAAVVSGALDYHFGGAKAPAPSKIRGNTEGSVVESVQSGSSGGSSGNQKKTEKEKKNMKNKMKPPKPTLSGADLMKSAGF